MNNPDLFDMYSCGMVLLQMVFPKVRSDSSIIAFNKKLRALNFDLRRWRAEESRKPSKEMAEGFELLDLDDGAGWDLLNQVGLPRGSHQCYEVDACASVHAA